MSRWDDMNFDNREISDYEEARLLKKFDQYRDLERIELEKRNKTNSTHNETKQSKGNRFLLITIIQAICVVIFTSSLIFFELVNSKIMNIVLVAALTALAGEIIIMSLFLRKRTRLERKILDTNTKKEFDFI